MKVLVYSNQDKDIPVDTRIATVIELGIDFPNLNVKDEEWKKVKEEITEHLIDLFRPLWVCNSQDFNFIFEGEKNFGEKIKELKNDGLLD